MFTTKRQCALFKFSQDLQSYQEGTPNANLAITITRTTILLRTTRGQNMIRRSRRLTIKQLKEEAKD